MKRLTNRLNEMEEAESDPRTLAIYLLIFAAIIAAAITVTA